MDKDCNVSATEPRSSILILYVAGNKLQGHQMENNKL